MAKRKTKSPTRIAYEKQVRRIKNFIRNIGKRGYKVIEEILPPAPKRYTKAAVERLKEIKPISIYKKSLYQTEDGFVAGTVGRQMEREAAARKGVETRKAKEIPTFDSDQAMIDNFIDEAEQIQIRMINRKQAAWFMQKIREWVKQMISKYGKHGLAQILEEKARQGYRIEMQMAYEEEILIRNLNKYEGLYETIKNIDFDDNLNFDVYD